MTLLLPFFIPFLVLLFPFCIILFLVYSKRILDTNPKNYPLRIKVFSFLVGIFVNCRFFFFLFRSYPIPIEFSKRYKNIKRTKRILPNGSQSFIWEEKDTNGRKKDEKIDLLPKEKRKLVMIYLLGGGFVIGNSLSKHKFYKELIVRVKERLKTKLTVIAPNYKKMPEHKGEEIVEECTQIVHYVFKHYSVTDDEGNVLLPNLIVSGDSAGGCLTLRIASWLRDNNYNISEDIKDLKRRVLFAPQYPSFLNYKQHKEALGTGKYKSRDEYMEKGLITNKRMFNAFFDNHLDDEFDMLANTDNMGSFIFFTAEHDSIRSEAEHLSNLYKKKNKKGFFVDYYMLEGECHSFLRNSKESHSFVMDKIIEGIDKQFNYREINYEKKPIDQFQLRIE